LSRRSKAQPNPAHRASAADRRAGARHRALLLNLAEALPSIEQDRDDVSVVAPSGQAAFLDPDQPEDVSLPQRPLDGRAADTGQGRDVVEGEAAEAMPHDLGCDHGQAAISPVVNLTARAGGRRPAAAQDRRRSRLAGQRPWFTGGDSPSTTALYSIVR
jgi:hypothetical protein